MNALRARLKAKVFLDDVEFFPNVDRAGKQAFLRSLSVFSVPGALWRGVWLVCD